MEHDDTLATIVQCVQALVEIRCSRRYTCKVVGARIAINGPPGLELEYIDIDLDLGGARILRAAGLADDLDLARIDLATKWARTIARKCLTNLADLDEAIARDF